VVLFRSLRGVGIVGEGEVAIDLIYIAAKRPLQTGVVLNMSLSIVDLVKERLLRSSQPSTQP